MRVRAYAKINLMLDILGKTEDGYHDLFMIMQSIGIYDDVTVELSGRPNTVSITCSDENIPTDKKNIAHKAAKAFMQKLDKKPCPGVKIHIEKNIPHAAGLAGGSADAAAVLYALNILTEANFSTDELCDIGVKIGADVPFCLKGGTMAAFDIGQVLAPLPPIEDKYIVLVKPDQSVSTKAAYDAYDTAGYLRHCDQRGMIHALANRDYDKAYRLIKNIFEQFVEVPDRVDIKAIMLAHNAKAACMSGSGPSVYAIFENEIPARACAAELQKRYKNVFVIKPVRYGLEIVEN
ncbi:MAG: 4-(cytidine 5'-diphospho)-2-C-methyl-D-erythritol kinase [Clostridia bacterium]|nr:4-(cytidine 5'-diphospho)-2-C-methyl-D-erythritol kinase [Clostridia bacterium]